LFLVERKPRNKQELKSEFWPANSLDPNSTQISPE